MRHRPGPREPIFATRQPMRSLALGIVLCICSGPAAAQTCAAPFPLIPNTTLPGTTCGGEHVADYFCGDIANPGPNVVYRFVLDSEQTVQLFISGIDFEPAMYLMDGEHPCDAAPCIGIGGATAPNHRTNLPPGSYWLIVAAAPYSPDATCGSFMLGNDMTPTDETFSNGFE